MTKNVDFINTYEVRPDFIPKESYLSADIAGLESSRMWQKTWHWACRLEEIPSVGDYVVHDVVDQSVIVVRVSETEIKAFHNVCPHRGRRLYSGSGRMARFHCIFHAWQWDLNGNNIRVLDQEQWEGCPEMASEDLGLSSVHTAEWAGFVFINMSEKPEPFDEFIGSAREALDPLGMDKMRYCWRVLIDVESNWKVAQEAFMESYHVWGTHPQFLQVIDEKNTSEAKGKHGRHYYANELPAGVPSRRLNKPPMPHAAMGEAFVKFIEALGDQVGNKVGDGQLSARSMNAARRAFEELPSGTPVDEVMGATIMAMKEAADAEGAFFPLMTPEQHEVMGNDWNIFPNLSVVPSFDGTLIFRAMPTADNNPDKCTIEMISLLTYGPGKEPKPERVHLTDWRSQARGVVPPLLIQDLMNMEDVQKGMHSIALKGLRPNPVQEIQVSHFHEVLMEYLKAES
ncbi:MAG: aromatic ring-hydroxylating dioxygenase subunit alpha [Spongiibacteraceae bacterium]